MLTKLLFAGWNASCLLQEWLERECLERPQIDPMPNLRVALVKQSGFFQLYRRSGITQAREAANTATANLGPIGLFTAFQTTYFIVRHENDPECTIWKQKFPSGVMPGWRMALKEELDQQAVPAADVDWGQFDLVIAVENAVPARIAKRFPRTLWATIIEHHRMPAFRMYMDAPPDGYDLFLNQHYGPTPRAFFRKRHVIEWPLSFSPAQAIAKLTGTSISKRRSLMLEKHQPPAAFTSCDLFSGFEIIPPHRETYEMSDYLACLSVSQFYLCPLFMTPRWGNALVEAAAADCIVVGDRRLFWNPSMIAPELHATSVREAAMHVRRLSNNAAAYETALNAQRRRVEWYAFHRPLLQMLDSARRLRPDTRLGQALPQVAA
jgi:hypothetical protein